MNSNNPFSQPVDRHNTYCTQWDFVQDRFGEADLLPFTISDMDFATAPQIIEAMLKRTQHGVFGYSRWQHHDFLSAIQCWFKKSFNHDIDTSQVVYGPSVIYMVSQLICQWSDTGEGVVIHTPAYDAFFKTIEGNHRKVRPCPLSRQGDKWVCDMAQLEALLAEPSTRILLLCSPHNPTGKVWSEEELSMMAALCKRHNVRVISDEIHMDLCWGEAKHIPWSAISTEPHALFTSASKSFNVPALTGAYGMISDTPSRDAYFNKLKVCDGLSSPAIFAVIAHIVAYTEADDWFKSLREYLFANLTYLQERLNAELPELHWQVPESTYLAWIDISPLNIDDKELQHRLIHQEKVAIMPGETYGEEGRGYIRFNVGCSRIKLADGLDRFIRAVKSFK